MASYEEEIRKSRRAAEDIVANASPKESPIDQASIRDRQRYAESAYNDRAESKRGAKGAFQIMPNVAEEYAKKMGEGGDLFDPDYNGRMRDRIYDELYNSFTATNGQPTDSVRTAKALAMYNRGRGAVGDFLQKQKEAGEDIYHSLDWVDKMPWKETRDYVNFVLRGRDIPDTGKTNEQYESAKKKKGVR